MAVLGASDGEIVWRRVMPKHEGGVKYLFSSRTGPITVSTNGVVRFWDNTNGRQGALVRETYPNEKSYKLGQCIRLSSRFQIICNYSSATGNFLQIYTESSSKESVND